MERQERRDYSSAVFDAALAHRFDALDLLIAKGASLHDAGEEERKRLQADVIATQALLSKFPSTSAAQDLLEQEPGGLFTQNCCSCTRSFTTLAEMPFVRLLHVEDRENVASLLTPRA